MPRPLVTIILTVFRRTEYLAQALRSALRQTFTDLEVIVTDDADSETARSICARFAADPRLRYRSNPHVLGAPLNIAAALNEAQGDFVAILNDDDLMEPGMLHQLLPPLQNDPHCVLSFGDHWIIDSAGRILPDATQENSNRCGRQRLWPGAVKDPVAIALCGSVPFVMGTLFRKSACRPEWLFTEVSGAYDYWLAVQLARAGGGFNFTPARVFRYRAHVASESGRLHPNKAECQVRIFSLLLGESLLPPHRAAVRRHLAHFLFVLGRDRLYFDQVYPAREAFRRSLQQVQGVKVAVGYAVTFLPKHIRSKCLRWRKGAQVVEASKGTVGHEVLRQAQPEAEVHRFEPTVGPGFLRNPETSGGGQNIPRISCVIPTLGRGRVVCETVRMLLGQTSLPHEIIIVDQTPEYDEPIREMLGAWEREGRIRWLHQSTPNASRARNAGALAASGDIVLFLDDDIRLGPNLLANYAEVFSRTGADGVAGQILEGRGETVDQLNPAAFETELGWLLHFPRNYSRECITSFMMSGNVALRRDLYLRLGGMDENYERGAYREESDLSMRARRARYRVVYSPACSIHHLGANGVAGGGARSWRRTGGFDYFHHCVGDWYFNFGFATAATIGPLLVRSLRHFVCNRHNVERPWRVPLALGYWLAAAPVGARRRWQGPRLVNTH